MHGTQRSFTPLLALISLGAFCLAPATVFADPALEPHTLQALTTEVLQRNPEIARARRLAAGAAARAPQVRALPDPEASLGVFLLPPETRVGPQRFSVALQQTFPGFGKLALREKAAVLEAAAAAAEVEAAQLDAVMETRRLAYELAFLDAQRSIISAERTSLVRYEQVSQGRYAAGSGLQQETLRIQAQITRLDTRLLEIAERRATLVTAVNGLRDRPAGEPFEVPNLTTPELPSLEVTRLRELARQHRPELVAEDARIAAKEAMVSLAKKAAQPGFTVGLAYTEVGSRRDEAGRSAPPPDNGDDILALTGSVRLPVWRGKIVAAVEEALAHRSAAEEERRGTLSGIEASIGDLVARLPLLFEHWKLLEGVLQVQAREALRSAETAYSTGRLNAVDLLDSEVVLFEVSTAAARTRADLLIALAQLERAVGTSLTLEDLSHE